MALLPDENASTIIQNAQPLRAHLERTLSRKIELVVTTDHSTFGSNGIVVIKVLALDSSVYSARLLAAGRGFDRALAASMITAGMITGGCGLSQA